jgi:hypothetical protein
MMIIDGLTDVNHNGHWDGDDLAAGFKKLGLVPGSDQAKKLWNQVDQDAHSPEAKAAAQKINPKAIGMFEGKLLMPAGGQPGQGDFQLLVQRLHYHDGLGWDQAKKIADAAMKKVVANQQQAPVAQKPLFTPGVKAAVVPGR